jgi:hypothetical protein
VVTLVSICHFEIESTDFFYVFAMQITQNIGRGTSIVLEALFGDFSPGLINRRPRATDDEKVVNVLPRTLLPCSVIHNPSTNMVSSFDQQF